MQPLSYTNQLTDVFVLDTTQNKADVIVSTKCKNWSDTII